MMYTNCTNFIAHQGEIFDFFMSLKPVLSSSVGYNISALGTTEAYFGLTNPVVFYSHDHRQTLQCIHIAASHEWTV